MRDRLGKTLQATAHPSNQRQMLSLVPSGVPLHLRAQRQLAPQQVSLQQSTLMSVRQNQVMLTCGIFVSKRPLKLIIRILTVVQLCLGPTHQHDIITRRIRVNSCGFYI